MTSKSEPEEEPTGDTVESDASALLGLIIARCDRYHKAFRSGLAEFFLPFRWIKNDIPIGDDDRIIDAAKLLERQRHARFGFMGHGLRVTMCPKTTEETT
ncbi:MAG TPA: hypothetical protein PKH39_16330 [Woeseiaceae bacterium]|nr:hypothetical protein [Woeseiaceae bacterium]